MWGHGGHLLLRNRKLGQGGYRATRIRSRLDTAFEELEPSVFIMDEHGISVLDGEPIGTVLDSDEIIGGEGLSNVLGELGTQVQMRT
jgi:hypothetical protein